MRRVARIALEWCVHGVVRHVQEERLPCGDCLGHARLGLGRERIGQKRLRAVVALEVRHGVGAALAVRLPAVITTRMADRPPAHVHVEAQIQRVGTLGIVRAEVRLADVDGAVAGCAQQRRQRDGGFREAPPVPFWRPLGIAVVRGRSDPVRRLVPRGVLARHDRDARRRAHAHRHEVVEPDSLRGQALHVRRAVVVVERIPHGPAVRTGQKRHRRVHDAHVVDQEHDDVRRGWCGWRRSGLGGSGQRAGGRARGQHKAEPHAAGDRANQGSTGPGGSPRDLCHGVT